jgi:hypothetical protein
MKEHMAGLDLEKMFVLGGKLALHTQIPNIVVFAHQDHRMEVVTSKFPEAPVEADMTRLELSRASYRSSHPSAYMRRSGTGVA